MKSWERRLNQWCSHGRQTRELNIAGVRKPVTANRRGTAQPNKAQGLSSLRMQAHSSFCSSWTVCPFWLDWEGRWGLMFSRVIYTPEENPQGLDSGKEGKQGKHQKRLCLVCPCNIHIHVPQAVCRKEWGFFKKKKNTTHSFPQSSVTLWWLKGGEGCYFANWTLPRGFVLLSTISARVAPRKRVRQVTFTLPWKPSLTWSD